MAGRDEPVPVYFPSADLWERWLSENHGRATGIWLKIARKGSAIPSVTIEEALDIALCHGWIDGQRKSLDEKHFAQKFTPRRARSLWSKRNIENVARLTAEGRMTPAGVAEVERAKADGRWDAAYSPAADMQVPEDFLSALEKSPAAKAAYEGLNRQNLYAIYFRLHTARRPETRRRRLEQIIESLKAGRRII